MELEELFNLVETGSVEELQAMWPLHLQAPLPLPMQDSILHKAVRRTDEAALAVVQWVRQLDVRNVLPGHTNAVLRTPLMEAVAVGADDKVLEALAQWARQQHQASKPQGSVDSDGMTAVLDLALASKDVEGERIAALCLTDADQAHALEVSPAPVCRWLLEHWRQAIQRTFEYDQDKFMLPLLRRDDSVGIEYITGFLGQQEKRQQISLRQIVFRCACVVCHVQALQLVQAHVPLDCSALFGAFRCEDKQRAKDVLELIIEAKDTRPVDTFATNKQDPNWLSDRSWLLAWPEGLRILAAGWPLLLAKLISLDVVAASRDVSDDRIMWALLRATPQPTLNAQQATYYSHSLINLALGVPRPPGAEDKILRALLSALPGTFSLSDKVDDALRLGGLPRMMLLFSADPLSHQGALAKIMRWAAKQPETVGTEAELLRILRYLAPLDKGSEDALGLLLQTHVSEDTLLQAAKLLQAAGHSTRWDIGGGTLMHYVLSDYKAVFDLNQFSEKQQQEKEMAFQSAAQQLERANQEQETVRQSSANSYYGRQQERSEKLERLQQVVRTAQQAYSRADSARMLSPPPRLSPIAPHCVSAALRMLAKLAPADIYALQRRSHGYMELQPQSTPLHHAVRSLDVTAVQILLSALPAEHNLSMADLIEMVSLCRHVCDKSDYRCQPQADEDGVVSRLACAQLCILQLLIIKAGPEHVSLALSHYPAIITAGPGHAFSPAVGMNAAGNREVKELLLETYDRYRAGGAGLVPVDGPAQISSAPSESDSEGE